MADLEKEIRNLHAGTATEAESRRIFSDLYPRVLRFFRRKGFVQEEAEDHAQEVLSRVFQQAASCRNPERFRSWVFAIASNLYRNELRDQQAGRRQGEEIAWDAPGIAEEAVATDDQVSPEQTAINRELHAALSNAIDALPPKRRLALMMCYQGHPYDEIARTLEITVGTVKAHIYQARQVLKAELAGYLEDVEPGDETDDES